MEKEIKKILVIRFRQIGDSILTAAMCNSLKKSFTNAEIHLVLNERIAEIFDAHPDIDKVITFSKEENGSLLKYVKKVWETVHKEKYDVIIDMRSTVRTLLFSLLSLDTPIRIGRKKEYARFVLNRLVDTHATGKSIIETNQRFADALNEITEIIPVSDFKLYVTEKERQEFKQYMQSKGIDFSRPVVLVGVTTKLAHKNWNREYMKETLKALSERYDNIQLIFNYAPGKEEQEAKRIYEELNCPETVKTDIKADSLRKLMALCSNTDFYFGNEGGTRHMIQALGIPSFSIYSPGADKCKWLPHNSTKAQGIGPKDVLSENESRNLSYKDLFDSITPEQVCKRLFPMLDEFIQKFKHQEAI